MATILAGPWVGEFGWELFCWQGYLRKLSDNGNKIIVVSRKTSKFLYDDFANKFIACNPHGTNTDAYKCIDSKPKLKNILKQNKFDKHIDPRKGIVFFSNESVDQYKNFKGQHFYKYGKKGSVNGYDVLVHARSTNKCGTYFRNWTLDKWEHLSKILKRENLSIASIGLKNDALLVPNTDDLLGVELKDMVDIMANSRIIAGPSSGPMHLASLCGLTQVVWSEHKNRQKYKVHWNPFNTKVVFYCKESWNPTVENAYGLIKRGLS